METAVTAGGGLSSSYSAVADAAATIPVSAADAVTDVVVMIITAAVPSSGS